MVVLLLLLGFSVAFLITLTLTLFLIPQPPIFGDFTKPDQPVYEDINKFKDLKVFMENSLDDYNNEPGVIAMNLVLFKDAIEHGMY